MNNIEIVVENEIVCGNPKIAISSKQSTKNIVFDCVNGTQTIIADIELAAYDTIEIRLLDRKHNNNSSSQTTVELLDLYIDNINLQHLILNGVLYPQYDINFVKEFDPPVSYCPGTVFYNNGVYELDIKLPIYKFIVDSYEKTVS